MCVQDIRLGRGTKSKSVQVTAVLGQTVKALGTRRDRLALFVTYDQAMINAVAEVRIGNVAQVNTDGFAMWGVGNQGPALRVETFGELVLGDIYITPFTLGGVVTVTEIYLDDPVERVAES